MAGQDIKAKTLAHKNKQLVKRVRVEQKRVSGLKQTVESLQKKQAHFDGYLSTLRGAWNNLDRGLTTLFAESAGIPEDVEPFPPHTEGDHFSAAVGAVADPVEKEITEKLKSIRDAIIIKAKLPSAEGGVPSIASKYSLDPESTVLVTGVAPHSEFAEELESRTEVSKQLLGMVLEFVASSTEETQKLTAAITGPASTPNGVDEATKEQLERTSELLTNANAACMVLKGQAEAACSRSDRLEDQLTAAAQLISSIAERLDDATTAAAVATAKAESATKAAAAATASSSVVSAASSVGAPASGSTPTAGVGGAATGIGAPVDPAAEAMVQELTGRVKDVEAALAAASARASELEKEVSVRDATIAGHQAAAVAPSEEVVSRSGAFVRVRAQLQDTHTTISVLEGERDDALARLRYFQDTEESVRNKLKAEVKGYVEALRTTLESSLVVMDKLRKERDVLRAAAAQQGGFKWTPEVQEEAQKLLGLIREASSRRGIKVKGDSPDVSVGDVPSVSGGGDGNASMGPPSTPSSTDAGAATAQLREKIEELEAKVLEQKKSLKKASRKQKDMKSMVQVLQMRESRDVTLIRKSEAQLKERVEKMKAAIRMLRSRLAVLDPEYDTLVIDIGSDDEDVGSSASSPTAPGGAPDSKRTPTPGKPTSISETITQLRDNLASAVAEKEALEEQMEAMAAEYDEIANAKISELVSASTGGGSQDGSGGEVDSKDAASAQHRIQCMQEELGLLRQRVEGEIATSADARVAVEALKKQLFQTQTVAQSRAEELESARALLAYRSSAGDSVTAATSELSSMKAQHALAVDTLKNELEAKSKQEAEAQTAAAQLDARLTEARTRIDSLRKSGGSDELREELKMWRQKLRCPVCNNNQRSVVLGKCWHVFCKPCIDRNIEIRQRKCPSCGIGFSKNDVHPIYF